MSEDRKTWTEEIKVQGEGLVAKVKELVREGNVRQITIKNEKGEVVVSFPLTLGVVGALLAPTLAAVGAVAALLTNCTIVIERAED
jgi:hypothetical protein